MVFFGGCINNLGFLDEVLLEPEAFSIKLFSVFFDDISITVSVFCTFGKGSICYVLVALLARFRESTSVFDFTYDNLLISLFFLLYESIGSLLPSLIIDTSSSFYVGFEHL